VISAIPFRVAALCALIGWLGCVSAGHCERIARSIAGADREIAPVVLRVLGEVSTAGRVTDPCAADAAIEAAASLEIRETIPLLRRIVDDGPARSSEDVVADALHALMLLGDSEAVPMARRYLDGPVSIAGTAVIILRSARDWSSTSAVAQRLAREPNLSYAKSFVALALAYLADSPETPPEACAVLERLRSNIDEEHTAGLHRGLSARYGCSQSMPVSNRAAPTLGFDPNENLRRVEGKP
jgi:hypothetical protein